MFKIGDFSKFSQVSVRALRLYDQMELLKPIAVDASTGYRYYSAEQLPRLNRIVAFKDLGFSLEQIRQLLDDQIPSAQMRGMLRLKQAEVQQSIALEQGRLRRIESRLQQIEQEKSGAIGDVILKPVEAQAIAAIRDILPICTDIKYLYDELATELHHQNVEAIGISQTLWHDQDYRLNDVDAEVVIPIHSPFAETPRIKSYHLAAVEQMACLIHHGSHAALVRSFNTLLQWIEINHYQIIGANREIYWQPKITEPNFIEANDLTATHDLVIEIQFPVGSLEKMDQCL
jgi:DNA-binding transcriptional MerR regulator